MPNDSNYLRTRNEVFKDLAVDALNTVPMLGSLTKALTQLRKAREQDDFESFSREMLAEGADGGRIAQLQGREGEAFDLVVKNMLADRESAKGAYYARAFGYLARHRLVHENPPLAEYIVFALREMSATDLQVFEHVAAYLSRKPPDAERVRYFNDLARFQAGPDRFMWHRRIAVQTLIRIGAFAALHPECPVWTTEHFDILVEALIRDSTPAEPRSAAPTTPQ